ncbi:MAG: hypothetical protein ACP5I1_21475, partial [Candidatus Hinthialibacter sp.]
VLIFAISLAWKSLRQEADDFRRLQWTFGLVGAVILCSPQCDPWMVTWIVPFLCFSPHLSWLYLSLACFANYALHPWEFPSVVRALEYTPFFVLLIWEWKFVFPQSFSRRDKK